MKNVFYLVLLGIVVGCISFVAIGCAEYGDVKVLQPDASIGDPELPPEAELPPQEEPPPPMCEKPDYKQCEKDCASDKCVCTTKCDHERSCRYDRKAKEKCYKACDYAYNWCTCNCETQKDFCRK